MATFWRRAGPIGYPRHRAQFRLLDPELIHGKVLEPSLAPAILFSTVISAGRIDEHGIRNHDCSSRPLCPANDAVAGAMPDVCRACGADWR